MTATPAARWPASPGAAALVAVPVIVTRRGIPVGIALVDVMRSGRHGQMQIIGGPGAGTVVEMKAEAVRQVGYRWRFACPLTEGQCNVLYMPPDAASFASWQGHGLVYAVTRERPLARRYRHARRLRRCLGEVLPEVTGPLPVRPVAMRGETYLRRCAEITALEAVLEGV
jgi:hypothetical protein